MVNELVQGVKEGIRLFEVRYVTNALQFEELAVGDLFGPTSPR